MRRNTSAPAKTHVRRGIEITSEDFRALNAAQFRARAGMLGVLDVQAFVWGDAGSAGNERFALLAQHDVALVYCERGAGLCACSGCQLMRAVHVRADGLGAEALVVLAHFVREAAALRLHNAEAVCWASGGKRWPLSVHEHAALSRCVGARVAALAPMTLRGAADVFEAQGIASEVGIGRHHGRCVGAGIGRAWASSAACTEDASENEPTFDAHDEFEGGMSHIREHRTCFVVRSSCRLEFKCGGKSEHVHLPLHMTTQHPKSEGRLVTQCWYNAAQRVWSCKVRKEYGSKLRVQRVLKLETADASGLVQSAAAECTWARPPPRSVHTAWGSQWPREYAGMFAKSAAVGVRGWQRCIERVPAARAPGLTGVISREQICAVVALLQPEAAVRVLEFFHSHSTPRRDADALCYSVLLGYTPCLAHVADAAVDLILHSMRCATGGGAPHDCERRTERAHLLDTLHASLLQGTCTGALAPLNEWSPVARAGLVPAVVLHYGAVLTVRGPLPLVSQPAYGHIFLDPCSLGERELHAELRARGFTELSADNAQNCETLKADMCADPFSQCVDAWEEIRLLRYALGNPCAGSNECKREFLRFAATCKQHARTSCGTQAAFTDTVVHAEAWAAVSEFLHADAAVPGQQCVSGRGKRPRSETDTDTHATPVYLPPCPV